jgi:4-amino-4-deoxy-L-arabinose transferase-like glycosyltransferase
VTPLGRDAIRIGGFAAILFLVALGARDLWNPNEPIYGQAVVEMERRGDWLVPWVNEMPFAEKPILYYWLALAASRPTGIDEFTLRLPTAAAGLAAVAGVWLLVLPYAGRRRARVAALLMATLYLVFWSARTIQMDLFVAVSTLGVLIPVSRVLDHGANPWKGWALAGVAAGLGFLAKGPVAWICPGVAIASYAAVTGRLRELLRPALVAGIATCLAVASPWYLLLWGTGRSEVLYEVLIRQNFVRFVEAWDHQEPWWYYVKYFWIDYAPWAPLALLAIGLPGRAPLELRLHRLAWSLLLAVSIFFSLSDSKRSPYTLPIAAGVAILAGEVAVRFVEGRLDATRRRLVLAFVGILGGVLVLGGAALALAGASRLPEYAEAARLTGLATALGGALAAGALVLRRPPRVVARASVAAVAVVYLAASIWALPAANRVKSARAIGEALAAAAGPEDRLLASGIWRWRANYAFYARRPIPPARSLDEVREAWASPHRVWVLVEDDALAELRSVVGEAEPAIAGRVGRTAVFVFSNQGPTGQ